MLVIAVSVRFRVFIARLYVSTANCKRRLDVEWGESWKKEVEWEERWKEKKR